MIYVTIQDGKAVAASSARPAEAVAYEYRADWKTFERAQEVAEQLTEATGRTFLATDAGQYTYPRYDVVEPPAVGDDVSYGFNGDYYPCGKVTRIGANYSRVYTQNEAGGQQVWHRVRKTGSWKEGGASGTWSLVKGTRFERNPHL